MLNYRDATICYDIKLFFNVTLLITYTLRNVTMIALIFREGVSPKSCDISGCRIT
jgi:hypothetical protein